MTTKSAAIIGTGYSLPPNIRTNDDPIFNWIKKHDPAGMALFQGYVTRRVLAPGQNLTDIMVPAALQAITSAGLASKDIDMILGYGSVSEFESPNVLAAVHNELNLPANCHIIPINNEFNNFNSALVLAHSMVNTGVAKNILIVCGSNWTRFVDYHTAPCVSAGDGAAAAVVSASTASGQFSFVDIASIADTKDYGVMYMGADELKEGPDPSVNYDSKDRFSGRYFHLTPAGAEAFKVFGFKGPVDAANTVLKRNKISSADVTLISHQASSVLMDMWSKAINPGQYINTIASYANMTLATIPVNFAMHYSQIQKNYVVLLGIGTELQTSAVLLKRN